MCSCSVTQNYFRMHHCLSEKSVFYFEYVNYSPCVYVIDCSIFFLLYVTILSSFCCCWAPEFLGDFSRFWQSCLESLVLLLPKLWICCLSNLSVFSVPDEGYPRNALCALNLISTFLFLNKESWKCNVIKFLLDQIWKDSEDN